MIDFSEVSRPSGPWVHHAKPDEALRIIESAASSDMMVIQLDGMKMRILDELFREYAQEFAFPDYFGWNWPAFDECMKELSWKPARAYLTIITQAEAVLSVEPIEIKTYLGQLEDIGRRWAGSFALSSEWGGGEVPFHTVFVDGNLSI